MKGITALVHSAPPSLDPCYPASRLQHKCKASLMLCGLEMFPIKLYKKILIIIKRQRSLKPHTQMFEIQMKLFKNVQVAVNAEKNNLKSKL